MPATEHMPQLALEGSSDGSIIVDLAGDWQISSQRVDPTELQAALDQSPKPACIRFQTDQIGHWDSSLLTFLFNCQDLAKARGIEVDETGLPEGARKLLDLARVVPPKTDTQQTETKSGFVTRVGETTLDGLDACMDFSSFLGETILSLWRLVRGKAQLPWSETLLVMQQTGPAALGIVALINFLVGMILAFVGAVQLTQFGAAIFVADLVAISTVREMGAIMTAIIMSGRTGAAFAAQLGTMTVNQEVDALKTFGISPTDYLVLPRILALVLMMPLLTIFADIIAIGGGLAVSTLALDLNLIEYLQRSLDAISLNGFLIGVFKGAFFGFLVGLSGCYFGIRSGRDAAAVGNAATSAVVAGITAIIAADGIFAVLTNILGI